MIGFIGRAAIFLCLWSVISGFSVADFLVGLVSAVGAAAASLYLLKPERGSVNLAACAEIALRLPFQSLAGGADIARRALRRDLPLRPCLAPFVSDIPQGPARNAFAALVSMQPGSVVIATEQGDVFLVHCLDDRVPIAASLAADEARVKKALGLRGVRG